MQLQHLFSDLPRKCGLWKLLAYELAVELTRTVELLILDPATISQILASNINLQEDVLEQVRLHAVEEGWVDRYREKTRSAGRFFDQ